MTSLHSSGGREREKADEFKYTSATNDEETFSSVVLREARRGFPQHTGTDGYIHGDSAVRLKQGKKGEGMHPCPLPLDLPSVSALLFVLPVFLGIAVSVCRLPACGRGL